MGRLPVGAVLGRQPRALPAGTEHTCPCLPAHIHLCSELLQGRVRVTRREWCCLLLRLGDQAEPLPRCSSGSQGIGRQMQAAASHSHFPFPFTFPFLPSAARPGLCRGAMGWVDPAHLAERGCWGRKGLSGASGGRNQRITGLLPDCPICHQHKDEPCLGLGCQ